MRTAGRSHDIAHRVEQASRRPDPGTTNPARELQRLLRAEADLERAIAQCKTALEEVRREIRWQDAGNGSVVH